MTTELNVLALSLPLPPSTNHLYRYGCRGRSLHVTLSDEYQIFRQVSVIELRNQSVPRQLPFFGRVSMTMDLYVQTARSDLSNYVKAAEDVVSDWLGFDDKMVYHIVLRKFIDAKRPRVEITLSPLETPWPVKKRSPRSKPSP
jgi:Holliday junction resolvase RusA-like endonuclease